MSRFFGRRHRSTRDEQAVPPVPDPNPMALVPTTPLPVAQQSDEDRLSAGDLMGSRASSESAQSSVSLRAKLGSLFNMRATLSRRLTPEELEDWVLNIQPELSKIRSRLFLGYEQSISYEPEIRSERPIAVIVCSDGALQREYQRKLDDSTDTREYLARMGWDFKLIVDRVKRTGPNQDDPHTASQKHSLGSALLGTSLLIRPPLTRVTIGGIVLVDGKPYGLTTAHGMWHLELGPSIQDAYSSLSGPARFAHHRFLNKGAGLKTYSHGCAGDWALVELDDADILPNMLALDGRLLLDTSISALWEALRDASEREDPDGPLLIQDVMAVEEYSKYVAEMDSRRPACLAVTSASVIPGLLDPGTATLDLGGTTFTVVRVCFADPIKPGDSGSWVFVQGRLFGTIIAIREPERSSRETAGGDDDDEPIKPASGSDKTKQHWAYVIPIEDTFRSIATTLSAVVKLPDLNDWRLRLLERQRELCRWLPMSDAMLKLWLPRHLDAERLLAEKKANDLSTGRGEDISKSTADTLSPAFSLRLGRRSRLVLDLYSHIHAETLESLLHLGDVCPLSPAFRTGFRKWLTSHRESGLHNPDAWAASRIVKFFTTTEAGENVLGLFFILWKTQRSTRPTILSGEPEPSKKSGYQHRRIKAAQTVWFANLLSTLLSLLGVHPSVIPSSEQLVRFVHCIVESFRDKDLNQLRLRMVDNTLALDATPADRHWRATSQRLYSEAFIRPVSYLSDKFLSVRWDRKFPHEDFEMVYRGFQPDEWYHDVTSTARLLLQLQRIALGDGSKILICTGQWARWTAFYAAVVLGIEVDFRGRLDEGLGSVPLRSPFVSRAAIEPSAASAGVVAYLDPKPQLELGSKISKPRPSPGSTKGTGVVETINRDTVAPVPQDLSARFTGLRDHAQGQSQGPHVSLGSAMEATPALDWAAGGATSIPGDVAWIADNATSIPGDVASIVVSSLAEV